MSRHREVSIFHEKRLPQFDWLNWGALTSKRLKPALFRSFTEFSGFLLRGTA